MIAITIDPGAYNICAAASERYWANSKPGQYGSGLLNTSDDPCRTSRLGLLGEAAFAIWLGDIRLLDTSYKQGGDKYDFKIGGMTINVKTRSEPGNKPWHIYRVNERGKTIPVNCDMYVCATLIADDRHEQTAVVELNGWIPRDIILDKPVVAAYRGSHKNIDIIADNLYSMKMLEQLQKVR